MASTSFSLGAYWDSFIKEQVAEGRYGTGTEVVREALRRMEVEEKKFARLKAHVEEGIRQAEAGEFVEDFDIEQVIASAKERAKKSA